MASTIKLLSPEVNLASATNVERANVVRVFNNATGIQIITHANALGEIIGTVTLAGGEVVYMQKAPTDTLLGVTTSKAVKIAFTN
jgi:hypothetical protein